MRALLLAAGMGTRLRPLTDAVPKCLVPVHGRPLLDYWLALLFDAGFERVLVNTHWLAQTVRDHVAASPWRASIDLVHEPELLGTGGTILANRSYFAEQPFLVAHADNLTDLDVDALVEAHRRRPAGCEMTMLAFRTDDPSSCGILELDGRGLVVGFHEKVADPPGDLANGAVYVIGPQVLDRLAAKQRPFIDLSTQIIPELVGKVLAVEAARYHRDIGNLASLARAHAEFAPRAAADR
ncbi:MAG: nucleotidyltransferase family protein [Roseiarcus sp.]|jgi:mannose-1-phosphate guanylyltransferase